MPMMSNLKAKSCKSIDPNGSHVSIEIRDATSQNLFQSPAAGEVNGQEHQVDDRIHTPSNFFVSLERLAELVELSDQEFLDVRLIAAALQSSTDIGIIGDENDLDCRIKSFGSNQESEGQETWPDHLHPVNEELKQLVLGAFKEGTIILLLCCATLSLLIDIRRDGPEKAFLDGAIIFLAIFVVINFGHIFRFLRKRWVLKKLHKYKKVVAVYVVRSGKMMEIPVSKVVVGDVVFLGTGDRVPADGLFIDGSYSCKLDDGLVERGSNFARMFTGAKVVEGNCRMLVTSVGKSTEMNSLIRRVKSLDGERINHMDGIDKMNSGLEKFWLSLSLFILMLQAFRCFLWKSVCDENNNNPDPEGLKNTAQEIVNEATKLMKKQAGGKINGLVSMLCILLFATRDGLPLGISILFFIASKKMKSFKAIIQKLSKCVTLGLITTVCISLQTSDLAMKYSEMAELWIGTDHIKDVHKQINGEVLQKLWEGICMNASGTGSYVEDSLLYWVQEVIDVDQETHEILEMYRRGAPDCILPQCSHYYNADGTMQTLDEDKRTVFDMLMAEKIASSNYFHCFAFACRKVKKNPKPEEKVNDDEKTFNNIDDGLTLIGLVCLKNPYPLGVRQAVKAYRDLGVNIKLMVDNVNVKRARMMALHSGILRPEDDIEFSVIEGSDFRNISDEEVLMDMIDKIQVIANASPADKLVMVNCLRKKDAQVIITTTGYCIRDFPSVVEADVGIYLGDSNVEMAKENADIIIIPGQNNIVTVANILWVGRYLCKILEKFLELHLTLNISAFTINLIFQASSSHGDEVQLSSVELLWTNLIIEALGAFALGILMVEKEPSNLQNLPVFGAGPIITKNMWRNVAIQCLFQVAMLMVLCMKGKDIFHIDDINVLKTMIFNSYVLCQVFTLIGAMKITVVLTKKTNILVENFLFLVVVGMIVALQMLLIEIMGVVAHWGKLDSKRWWICIGLAALSSSLSFAGKRVSDFVLPCK
ncbi:hypothetical protein ACH5RR_038039 [Cinchona calisaya]|uniref:Calcium-transporting ATPase n=1 Tax=Cinchona calisaya TaxID=153742 RepID=A0ABD2YCN2_9GENT